MTGVVRCIGRLGRPFAASLVLCVALAGLAAAQTAPVRGVPHAVVTAPPLPFGNGLPAVSPSPAPAPGAARSTGHRPRGTNAALFNADPLGFRYVANAPPLPVRVPTLREAMAHMRTVSSTRRPRSGAGATIILNGTNTVPNPVNQSFMYGFDGTLAYGEVANLQCMNMPATGANTTYTYYVFPPKGGAAIALTGSGSSVTIPAAGGNCTGVGMTTTFGAALGPAVTFSTPYGVNSDAAYSGVWAVAMLNGTTNKYDAVSFVVVVGSESIVTSSDSSGSVVTNDFAPGSVVYMTASNLNTGDSYAFGIMYNGAATNVKCVYSLPAGTMPATGPCFNNGGTYTGVSGASGALTVGWNTSTGTSWSGVGGSGSLPGTYEIQLLDLTRNVVVGTTRVSINSGASTWTLTPYNGATAGAANGYNGSDVFAFDGAADQAVKQLDLKVSGGMKTGNNLTVSVTDPNGQVLIAPVTGTGAATVDFGKVTLPLKAGASTTFFGQSIGPFYPARDVFGPTALTNAGNVYTVQLYDRTSGAALDSKSFQLLGYNANMIWQGTQVLQPAGGTTVTGTVVISNSGYAQLGALNADGLVGFKISGTAGVDTVSLPGGVTSTTATDTSGKIWNVALNAAGGGTVTITPAIATYALAQPATATLSLPLVVTIAAGQCTTQTACHLDTAILPQHGVGVYSAQDVVSTPLAVAANGAGAATAGTYSVAVSTYPAFATPGIAPAPLPAPNFARALYVAGTDGTSGATTYNIALSVTASSGEEIHSMLLTLPPGMIGANATLAYVCAPPTNPLGNCNGGVGNWATFSPATAGLSNATPNQVYLWSFCMNGNQSCGVTMGTTTEFVLTVPMSNQTDTYADTALIANPDGGCPASAQAYCSNPMAPLTYNPSTGTSNSPVNASGSNLDATELGVFSLDPTQMSVLFSPSTIGAVVTTTTLNFTNAGASSSLNPDYLDTILLSIPNGAIPNSITIPASSPYFGTWTVTKMSNGPPGTWKIVDNCLPACTPGNITNAIAPGANFPLTFNYTTAPTTGNYTVTWYALGANGNVYSSAGTSALQVNSTSAAVAFVGAGGPPYAGDGVTQLSPNTVGGMQPFVGSDATQNVGSVFDYRITNNGATAITSMTISMPYQNTFSVTPNNNTWAVTGSNVFFVQPMTSPKYKPTLSGTGASTCSVGTIVQATGTTTGSIPITCTTGFTNGQYIDVRFVMEVPYDIGSNYVFPTLLNGAVTGTPTTPLATTLGIVLDAQLTMFVPVAGGTSTISRPETGSTAATSCLGCLITASTGAVPANINFGQLAGTFNGTNLVNASVTSDASGAHGWNLYVSVDNNPLNVQTSSALLLGSVNSASSSVNGAYTITPAIKDTLIALPVVNPAPSGASPNTAVLQKLATYSGGTLSRGAVDTLMNFRVNGLGDVNTARTVIVTYTLVPN